MKKLRLSTKIFLNVIIILLFAAICKLLFIKDQERPYLTVIGNSKMADGIGRQSIELIHAFYKDFSIGFIPEKKNLLQDVPKELLPIITNPNKTLGKIIIYEACLPCPGKKSYKTLNKFLKGPKNKDQIRIAYSMIESSLIPKEWAEMLNNYFDLVAVPDEFLVKVYKDSGVTIPIFVLPLGLELNSFLEKPTQVTKCKKAKPFRFINVSSMIPRKNHEALIKAFYRTFKDNPDVELYINFRTGPNETLVKIKNLISSLNAHNIILTNKKLDNAEYLKFFMEADVFVSFSKGEGFSIQPREAMALGIPVVISDNTAHKTILKSGLAIGVLCSSKEPAYNPFLHCYCGEEYITDEEDAVKTLLEIYNNYATHIKLAEDRKKWVNQYCFENLKPLYLSLVKPSNIELGDENIIKENCLITSSPELYQKYCNIFSEDPK